MRKIGWIVLGMLSIVGFASGEDLSREVGSDLELLGALHQVRAMWVDPGVADWQVRSWIDDQVDLWRGPLTDGSYEWIVRERPESEVLDRSEHLVYGTVEQPARIEDGASWVYGVRIVVPRKRSLFRGNNPVWVESLTIRSRSDEMGEDTIPIGRWFTPNSSQTWDFDSIVSRADVVAEVAAEPDRKGESLVEIHFLESVELDDPEGPHYAAIRALQELDEWLNAERIDRSIAEVEGRLIPGAQSIPIAMLSELLDRALASLDNEDPEEQKKARADLVEALEMIREP